MLQCDNLEIKSQEFNFPVNPFVSCCLLCDAFILLGKETKNQKDKNLAVSEM